MDGPTPTGTPDLIVRQDITRHEWVARLEDFTADQCSAVEGGISPGTHHVLRFSVSASNVGDGDLIIGDPNVHYNHNDGLFELATCHNHFHYRRFATYELVSMDGSRVWQSAKRGFCFVDSDPEPSYIGPRSSRPVYTCCGEVGRPGNQGIARGWSDKYKWSLAGQFFVLDGGDGQPVIPPGDYKIRVTLNPGFPTQQGEPCPNIDGAGLCRMLRESDYTNNVFETSVAIPVQPTRAGSGPLTGAPAGEEEPPAHC
jgi:hypothetical protein